MNPKRWWQERLVEAYAVLAAVILPPAPRRRPQPHAGGIRVLWTLFVRQAAMMLVEELLTADLLHLLLGDSFH